MENIFFEILEDAFRQEIALKNTKIYRIAIRIMNLWNSIKKGFLIENITREWRMFRVRRLNTIKINSNFQYGDYPNDNIKILVYTCITKGYDTPAKPLFTLPNVDYILYTDNEINNCDGWQICGIPTAITKLKNGTLVNRYFKMHPTEFAHGYDYAIYIDGNIQIMSNIRNIINIVSHTTGLAIHRHPSRNCIFNEYRACKIMKKGNIKKMQIQIERYKKEGFPLNYGLLECTIIVSDLHHERCKQILEMWWNEFINSESMRDQLCLPYVLWRNRYTVDDIGNLGYNLKLNPKFKFIVHNSENNFLI